MREIAKPEAYTNNKIARHNTRAFFVCLFVVRGERGQGLCGLGSTPIWQHRPHCYPKGDMFFIVVVVFFSHTASLAWRCAMEASGAWGA